MGLVSCWIGPGYGTAIQQDINIKLCYDGMTSSKAMKTRWMQVISRLLPNLKSLHRAWFKS